MFPKVSILLPNLNNLPYLEERIQTILDQTLSEWELIVVDSYSDDGAWEYFEECAQKDKRIRIYQSKEKGIYNNFNKCIKLSQGEYIYFATSNDTMDSYCLQKMVAALDEYPECDLAHCKLLIIDEKGDLSTDMIWDDFFIIRYFDNLVNQKHIRLAPHDGFLHFSGITVYTSLTQILIRKRLFDKVGFFSTNFGGVADYEWVMRATMIANTLHIPEYLATWRLHENQVTVDDSINIAKASGKFIRMANHAIKIAKKLNPSKIKGLKLKKLRYILEKEKLYFEIKGNKSILVRCFTIFKWLFINFGLVFELYKSKRDNKNFISQKDFLEYTKKMIKKHGLEKNLKIIENN